MVHNMPEHERYAAQCPKLLATSIILSSCEKCGSSKDVEKEGVRAPSEGPSTIIGETSEHINDDDASHLSAAEDWPRILANQGDSGFTFRRKDDDLSENGSKKGPDDSSKSKSSHGCESEESDSSDDDSDVDRFALEHEGYLRELIRNRVELEFAKVHRRVAEKEGITELPPFDRAEAKKARERENAFLKLCEQHKSQREQAENRNGDDTSERSSIFTLHRKTPGYPGAFSPEPSDRETSPEDKAEGKSVFKCKGISGCGYYHGDRLRYGPWPHGTHSAKNNDVLEKDKGFLCNLRDEVCGYFERDRLIGESIQAHRLHADSLPSSSPHNNSGDDISSGTSESSTSNDSSKSSTSSDSEGTLADLDRDSPSHVEDLSHVSDYELHRRIDRLYEDHSAQGDRDFSRHISELIRRDSSPYGDYVHDHDGYIDSHLVELLRRSSKFFENYSARGFQDYDIHTNELPRKLDVRKRRNTNRDVEDPSRLPFDEPFSRDDISSLHEIRRRLQNINFDEPLSRDDILSLHEMRRRLQNINRRTRRLVDRYVPPTNSSSTKYNPPEYRGSRANHSNFIDPPIFGSSEFFDTPHYERGYYRPGDFEHEIDSRQETPWYGNRDRSPCLSRRVKSPLLGNSQRSPYSSSRATSVPFRHRAGKTVRPKTRERSMYGGNGMGTPLFWESEDGSGSLLDN